MAIPARQIGQPSSTKAQLLWNISKQLETLTKVAGNVYIAPKLTGGWSVVTGGVAGDGTVAQYSSTGFNITGPDDNQDNGWVYIKQYFPNGAQLVIDYQWASSDEGAGVDRPIYCIDDQEPTGIPSNIDSQVGNTPETGTWNVTVSPGQWFSVGIYSVDSCCGRGFLSVDVMQLWSFVPNEISVFPTSSAGYTLYTGGFSNNDDGQSDSTFPLAGDFYTNNIVDNTAYLSTNGFIIPLNSGFQIYGNQQDLYLTPGQALLDGDIQNFWYQNTGDASKWKTSILVYCGHCCGDPNQFTPYSYVLNIYRDGQYQYMEACTKTSNENTGNAGVDGNTQTSYPAAQVWQSDLDGNNWNYLGFGSVQ